MTARADEYRAKMRASGDKAEMAAIDGMSDAWLEAVLDGDHDRAKSILLAEVLS